MLFRVDVYKFSATSCRVMSMFGVCVCVCVRLSTLIVRLEHCSDLAFMTSVLVITSEEGFCLCPSWAFEALKVCKANIFVCVSVCTYVCVCR